MKPKLDIPVLALCALLCGCSSFETFSTPFSVRNPLIHGQLINNERKETTFLQEKARSFIAAHNAATTEASASNLRAYVGTGITYSQLLCKRYFDELSFTKAHRDFAKRATNLSAGLTSTMLGLAKASSSGVAAAGAAFSFGQSSFDAYNESYIVTPELANLERLVREKQKEEELLIYRRLNATEGNWPDRVESLDQADRLLNDYIFHCTVNGLRILLASSIQAKTAELDASSRDIQNKPNVPASQFPQK